MEIRYHRGCWRKYVSDYKPLGDNTQHLQHVNRREAQTIFFQHVQHVIFQDHKIRTLQGLLVDYNRIVTNHGHSSIVKSGYKKEILAKKFGRDIGFYVRTQKNVSELVYDTRAAGISSLGVSDDQLLMNVAARIRELVPKENTIPWPPYDMSWKK